MTKYQDKSRRTFIQSLTAVSAGAAILPQWACSKAATSGMNLSSTGSLDKFGIQLYTLRDIIPDDPKGTLKQLASYGFNQIEGYEGKQGMFWGMKPKEFKSYLDDIGVKMVSSHSNIHENFEQKAADAASIGIDYLICPYIGPQKSVEDWQKVTEKFNNCGRICKENGIRFAYHNHAYTFKAFSGMMPQDFLMENTDPDLVDHQMDIYWVVTGGADPADYLTRYPNRFRLVHVKDRKKDAPADEHSASCNLGTGSIDFASILKTAKAKGVKYFIMEQERYDGSTPMDSAKVGADYLKNLKFV